MLKMDSLIVESRCAVNLVCRVRIVSAATRAVAGVIDCVIDW